MSGGAGLGSPCPTEEDHGRDSHAAGDRVDRYVLEAIPAVGKEVLDRLVEPAGQTGEKQGQHWSPTTGAKPQGEIEEPAEDAVLDEMELDLWR